MRTSKSWQKDVADTHFKDPNTYQQKHYDTAVKHVVHRGTAIDVGAHIGIHTVRLSQDFGTVYAIEPINYEYLIQNTQHCDNVRCIHAGASNTLGKMYAHNPAEHNSGAWELTTVTSKHEVDVITIDSLNLTECDLIKIDTQGLEQQVVEGARETIAKFTPVIWIEDKGTLVNYMFEELGYRLWDSHMKESVYTRDEQYLTTTQARLLSYKTVKELTDEQKKTIWG